MTFDLTNPYGTPFGLLDEVYGPGSQQALIDCGGPWEYWSSDNWLEFVPKSFNPKLVYRRRPEPPKPAWPEEIWVNFYDDGYWEWYNSRAEADAFANQGRIACVRYVPAKEGKE